MTTTIIGVDGERIEVIGVEDWEQWCPYFEAMDASDRHLDSLDADLDEAVRAENFGAAARIKGEILELEQADPVIQAETRLADALAREDYPAAARARDEGLGHLVGWWAGKGERDDHHGHLLRVFSRYGRFYGVAYSARDIAESVGWQAPGPDGVAGGGVPTSLDMLGMAVLEIFLKGNGRGGFDRKSAYLLPLPSDLDDLDDAEGDGADGWADADADGGAGGALAPEAGEPDLGAAAAAAGELPDDDSSEGEGDLSAAPASYFDPGTGKLRELDPPRPADPTGAPAVEGGAGPPGAEGKPDLATASWQELVGRGAAPPARRDGGGEAAPPAAAGGAPGAPGRGPSPGPAGGPGPMDPLDEDWSAGAVRSLEQKILELGRAEGQPVEMERVPAVIELVGRDRFTVEVKLDAVAGALERELGGGPAGAEAGAGGGAGARPGGPGGAAAAAEGSAWGRGGAAGARGERIGRVTDFEAAPPGSGGGGAEGGSDGVKISIELSDEDLARMGLSAQALQRISGGLSEAIAAKVQREMQAGQGEELTEERVAELVSETVQEVAESFRFSDDAADGSPQAAPGAEGVAAPEAAAPARPGAAEAPAGLAELESALAGALSPSPARTAYRKIRPEQSVPGDPFTGLYIGTFGPHGPEVLRLERSADEEGAECVTAYKVTGDVHVPAGEVSFRARIGRGRRLPVKGAYPEQLGISSRYKGQGRIAAPGFQDPQWTDGELVQFTPSAQREVTNGAELGFLWSISHRAGTQRFLILLNRVNLDLERAFF